MILSLYNLLNQPSGKKSILRGRQYRSCLIILTMQLTYQVRTYQECTKNTKNAATEIIQIFPKFRQNMKVHYTYIPQFKTFAHQCSCNSWSETRDSHIDFNLIQFTESTRSSRALANFCRGSSVQGKDRTRVLITGLDNYIFTDIYFAQWNYKLFKRYKLFARSRLEVYEKQ